MAFKVPSALIFVALIILSAVSCRHNEAGEDHGSNIDTLKVVTLYGPTSFFNYREDIMGIDYENVKRFAEEEGMVLEISPLKNIADLIEALKSGEAHLAAYPVPLISEFNEDVIYCGHREISRQILVQNKYNEQVSDVTDLIDKDIYVENNSKYLYRLQNLNEELGGGINIIPIDNDTIDTEDLLQMVNLKEIPFTVVDSEIASLYKQAFPSLDFSLSLSSDQASSWIVAPGLDSLAAKIDRWDNRTNSSEFVKNIYRRYYQDTINEDFDSNLDYFKNKKLQKGEPVSSFDNLFKKNSSIAGYDWKLLAAIAFCESKFNPAAMSRFGATGLMQVMPVGARQFKVDAASLANPVENVFVAAKILSSHNKKFEKLVEDPQERMKFVVAAYNSGIAHIYDAMALAEKHGLNSQKWNGNVSVASLMKSRPEYYNDPVVKYGYFRGRETVDFVDRVMTIYNYLNENINEK